MFKVYKSRAHNKPKVKVVHFLLWLNYIILMGSENFVDYFRISVFVLIHRLKVISNLIANKFVFEFISLCTSLSFVYLRNFQITMM